ncbi:MAG: hypothetical protein M1812_000109 [Candelaria pacifica]|nr:MAG: hypothetical protein M1812_000109 [Candelaria pacifica]
MEKHKSSVVWFCCFCADGPNNDLLILKCPNCDHKPCHDCTTLTGEEHHAPKQREAKPTKPTEEPSTRISELTAIRDRSYEQPQVDPEFYIPKAEASSQVAGDQSEDLLIASQTRKVDPPIGHQVHCGFRRIYGRELATTHSDEDGTYKDRPAACVCNIEALSNAARSGQLDIVQNLILGGVDINAVAHPSISVPLEVAAECGHVEIVKLLIRSGADAKNPLSLSRAVDRGDAEVVDLLLDAGAPPREDVLLAAAKKGRLIIVKSLLKHRPSANTTSLLSPRILHDVAEAGDHPEVFKLLLEQGADIEAVNTPYRKPERALHTAARYGHVETVKLLLEHGANIEAATDRMGERALLIAAYKGHPEIVKHGADIEAATKELGERALHIAAYEGHPETVKLLLDHGADVEAVYTFYGCSGTALYIAAQKTHVETVKLLLERGANIEAVSTWGGKRERALHTAARNGHLETLKLLLKHGADIEAGAEQTGMRALHIAAYKGHSETVKLLLEHGADIEAATKELGERALHIAAYKGHPETVKLLLEHGADIEATKQPQGETALCEAARGHSFEDLKLQQGCLESVKVLLDHGADIEAVNAHYKNSVRALSIAAQCGHVETVKLLLERGANIEAVNPWDGKSKGALSIAAQCGHVEVVKLLLERGANIEAVSIGTWDGEHERALHTAARNGCLEIAKLLLEHGADIEAATEGRCMHALHVAARSGHPETVKLLLEHGANIEATTKSMSERALHMAARRGHPETVKLLLEHGADIEATRQPLVVVALREAARERSFEIRKLQQYHLEPAKVLLEYKANTEAVTHPKGETALHLAARNDDLQTVKLLLSVGANVNATAVGDTDRTPLQAAVLGHHFEIARDLLAAGADVNIPAGDENTETALQTFFYMNKPSLMAQSSDEVLQVEEASKTMQLRLHKDRRASGSTPTIDEATSGLSESIVASSGKDKEFEKPTEKRERKADTEAQGQVEVSLETLKSDQRKSDFETPQPQLQMTATTPIAAAGSPDRAESINPSLLKKEVSSTDRSKRISVNLDTSSPDLPPALPSDSSSTPVNTSIEPSAASERFRHASTSPPSELRPSSSTAIQIDRPPPEIVTTTSEGGTAVSVGRTEGERAGGKTETVEDVNLIEGHEDSNWYSIDNRTQTYADAYADTLDAATSDIHAASSILWNTVTIHWKCDVQKCGESFEEDIQERIPGAAAELARELNYPDELDVTDTRATSDEGSSSSASTNGCRPRKNGRPYKEVIIPIDNEDRNTRSVEAMSVNKYILLCLSSRGSDERLEHANVTASGTDRCMYHVLNQGYFTNLRRSVRWLTMRTLDRVEFVRWARNVAIEAGDVGSLPPNSMKEYEYDRQDPTRPIVPLTCLKHFIEHPDHASERPLHLKRIPKKVDGELEWNQDGGEKEGWGLRIRERICWRKVFIFEALLGVLAIIIAIILCQSSHRGLQDGFTVAAVVLAYGTIFLGLIQGVAQLLERR